MQAKSCVLLMLGVMGVPLGILAAPLINEDLTLFPAPETTPASSDPVSISLVPTAPTTLASDLPPEPFEKLTWEEALFIGTTLFVVVALLAWQMLWLVQHYNEEGAQHAPDVLPAPARRFTVSYIANPPTAVIPPPPY